MADLLSGVVQCLYDNPEGFEPPVRPTTNHIRAGKCKQFTTVEAKKGDVLILHALLPHTNSFNYRHYPRIISNPHVCLTNPHNLNRPDGNYVSVSLLSIIPYGGRTNGADENLVRRSVNRSFCAVLVEILSLSTNRADLELHTTLVTLVSSRRGHRSSWNGWLLLPKPKASQRRMSIASTFWIPRRSESQMSAMGLHCLREKKTAFSWSSMRLSLAVKLD